MPSTVEVDTGTRYDFEIWSTTGTLVVTDPAAMTRARAELAAELASIEITCSRFRDDSEISRIVRHPGVEVTLSPVLNEVITQTLRVAAATNYVLDPTVAAAVISLGYDRSFPDILAGRDLSAGPGSAPAAPGAWRIQHDPGTATLLLPIGVGIDLGATAKSLAADRAVQRIAAATGSGVLVSLGGDVAVAGEPPTDGWRIAIGDDHRHAEERPDDLVAITSGGLATSSVAVRRWQGRLGEVHHIIDPRTGANPTPYWRTVSATAGSCLDANAAATAAIVLGVDAPKWLAEQNISARLVHLDSTISLINGWPTPMAQVNR